MRRVGLLGGTFNPPHAGHLKLADIAMASLGLDEVRLVPTALPPHKAAPTLDGPARLRLLQDLPYPVETLEIDRGGASYTVRRVVFARVQDEAVAKLLILS